MSNSNLLFYFQQQYKKVKQNFDLNMALVPKLPDISQNSLKIFERELSKAKKENKNQLFPKFSEDTEQRIKYTSNLIYVNLIY